MKNFVQPGRTVTLPAPYTVASGAGLLVGALFGVANYAALANEPVEADVEGVFDLPKANNEAWTIGAKVYWDNTAKVCTVAAAGGANTLIGAALLPVGSAAGLTAGRVRLNGFVA